MFSSVTLVHGTEEELLSGMHAVGIMFITAKGNTHWTTFTGQSKNLLHCLERKRDDDDDDAPPSTMHPPFYTPCVSVKV